MVGVCEVEGDGFVDIWVEIIVGGVFRNNFFLFIFLKVEDMLLGFFCELILEVEN